MVSLLSAVSTPEESMKKISLEKKMKENVKKGQYTCCLCLFVCLFVCLFACLFGWFVHQNLRAENIDAIGTHGFVGEYSLFFFWIRNLVAQSNNGPQCLQRQLYIVPFLRLEM